MKWKLGYLGASRDYVCNLHYPQSCEEKRIEKTMDHEMDAGFI